MTDFITFTIVGLALGSIYAIAASGLVVTYATSGIFNFAHGALGMFSAFLYWQLRYDWGWPAPVAIVATVLVAAPLMGVFLQVVIMKWLEGTSEITKIMVPIAVLLMINGLATWIWSEPIARNNVPFFGATKTVKLGDVSITYHQIIAFVVACVIAVALRTLLYGTRLGVTMRAVVDNRELAMLNGGRPTRAALASWAIGSMLAAVAGVLISPLTGALSILPLTLLVVNAYAAAVFGRLRNLPMTFVGALVLGLLISYWNWISEAGSKWGWLSGLRTSIPTIVLFIVLLLLPQDRLRGAVITRTRERFHLPTMKLAWGWGAVFLVVMFLISGLMEQVPLNTMSQGIALAILALSLVLLTGFAGEVNLAVYSFAGIGAIAAFQFDVGAGGLATQESLTIFGLIFAAFVTAIVGGLVALPALRLRGLYLGLATFAFAIFVQNMVFTQITTLQFRFLGLEAEINLFSGGTMTMPRPDWFGIDFGDRRNWLMFLSVVFTLIAVALVALRRSAYGRQLAAMKDSPAACATLGLNLVRLKLSVFMLSAGIAGLGGVLFGAQVGAVNNQDTFNVFQSLALFALTVAGGIGYVSGALVGGLFAGVMFVAFGDWWDKLALDYPAFDWLFHWLHDFFVYVGPAMLAIGTAKKPSGIAHDFIEGYGPLRNAKPVVGGYVLLQLGLWGLAMADVITNWNFAIATAVLVLLLPAVAMKLMPEAFAHLAPAGAEGDGTPLELIGIDRPYDEADRRSWDVALQLPAHGSSYREDVAGNGSTAGTRTEVTA
jgi:branched-subunit amino acid ABC-type transport system permease component